MNAKDFLRIGVPLGEATRRATDFVARFVLSGVDKSRLENEVKAEWRLDKGTSFGGVFVVVAAAVGNLFEDMPWFIE